MIALPRVDRSNAAVAASVAALAGFILLAYGVGRETLANAQMTYQLEKASSIDEACSQLQRAKDPDCQQTLGALLSAHELELAKRDAADLP